MAVISRTATISSGITESYQTLYSFLVSGDSEAYKTPFYSSITIENVGDSDVRICVVYTPGKTVDDDDSIIIQTGDSAILYNTALTNLYLRTEDDAVDNAVQIIATNARYSSIIYE